MASRVSRLFVLALISLLTAAPARAEWRRVDSPNFIVVGDVGARELRDAAVRFEGFREALSRVLSQSATAAAVPTVVIVFPNDKALTPFKPIYKGKPTTSIGGMSVPGPNANYIAILSGGSAEWSERVIFHEYAHLVMANLMGNIPVWLNEGLAEFYSTFKLTQDGREAQLGLPIRAHLALLNRARRIALPDLLKVDHESPLYNEKARQSVFYAESWALTHLIFNGEPSRLKELSAYLERVAAGTPEAAAWDESFGAGRMDKEFSQYLTYPVFRYRRIQFPEKIAAFPVSATSLPQSDADAFLSAFLVQQQRYDEAAARLGPVLEIDRGHPLANAVMADVEISRRDYSGAEKRLLGLRASDDWFVAYEAGVALAEVVDAQRRAGLPPDAAPIDAARFHFKTVGQHAEVPNVLARQAMLELRGETPSADAIAAVERARALAPGRTDYTFLHAEVLARRGDFAAARTVIGPLMTGAYPVEIRDTARKFMTTIVSFEARSRLAGMTPASSVGAASRPVPTAGIGAPGPRADAPLTFIPIFRVVGPDERRVEGTLENIDCAPGAVVFEVRTADGLLRLNATGMADVDFFSYRDDLKGEVACGAFKEPLKVYATSRETNARPRTSVVVAIEFLSTPQ